MGSRKDGRAYPSRTSSHPSKVIFLNKNLLPKKAGPVFLIQDGYTITVKGALTRLKNVLNSKLFSIFQDVTIRGSDRDRVLKYRISFSGLTRDNHL